MSYPQVCFPPTESLMNSFIFVLNPLTEFPTGLSPVRTIHSLVCSQGTR